MESAGFEYSRPRFISLNLRRPRMGDSIDLDNQFSIHRYKVDNESIDRMLAAKLPVG
jgi:hypothetical protein